jgi:hypothetical protein
MTVLVWGFIAFAVACGLWRANLILNHPEKEARLREYEERQKQARREMFNKAAPVVGTGAKLLFKVLTKGRK